MTNREKKRAKEEKEEARKQKAIKGKPPECPNLVCVPYFHLGFLHTFF